MGMVDGRSDGHTGRIGGYGSHFFDRGGKNRAL